jgi:hypothetical protein
MQTKTTLKIRCGGLCLYWKAESGGLQAQIYSEALSPKAKKPKPKQAIKQTKNYTDIQSLPS